AGSRFLSHPDCTRRHTESFPTRRSSDLRQEVLLLDAEGIFGDVLAAGSRADHQAPFVVAQAQPEPFEYSRVQSHVIDPVRLRGRGFAARLRAGPPATAANALSGSFRLQGFAACDR